MVRQRPRPIAVTLVVTASLLCGCHGNHDMQMPVTTRSETARQHFVAGRDLFDIIRNQEARRLFELAVSEDSLFALAYLHLSRVEPTPKGTLRYLRQALSLMKHASEPEQLLILVDQARANQDLLKERELVLELIDRYPSDVRLWLELSIHYVRQKAWGRAIEIYSRAVEIDPGCARCYNGLGYCYRFVGNLPAAEENLLKYMELIPDDPNAYDSYADLLTEMNRHREAIQFYRRTLDLQPDFTASHFGIANNLNILGKHAEARAQMKHLYEIAQDDGRRRAALLGLAISCLEQGDIESALKEMEESCQIAESAGDAQAMAIDLDNIGLVLLENGRPEEASRAFTGGLQTLVESDAFPGVIQYAQLDYMQRSALVWLNRGNLKQASELATRYQAEATRLQDPTRIRTAHQTLGLIALRAGELQTAVAELSQADLQQAYNQYYLALAQESAGDLLQALRLYRQASTYDQFSHLTRSFVRRKALQKVESLRLARRSDVSAGKQP